jgi:translation initiation factor IF-2
MFDHGNTSLLDAIRQSNVTEAKREQYTAAYRRLPRCEVNGRLVTFLDTPGARRVYSSMRAAARRSPIYAVLVGYPRTTASCRQTVEAINHAKAANVSYYRRNQLKWISPMQIPTG